MSGRGEGRNAVRRKKESFGSVEVEYTNREEGRNWLSRGDHEKKKEKVMNGGKRIDVLLLNCEVKREVNRTRFDFCYRPKINRENSSRCLRKKGRRHGKKKVSSTVLKRSGAGRNQRPAAKAS